ncbi:hypothetical protein M758_N010700 [Ceratodon purpureus]|nr:hypothetical protein M758_N010700 [Ceratodon purpureus]
MFLCCCLNFENRFLKRCCCCGCVHAQDFLGDMIEKRKNSSAYSITHVIFSDFDMIVVDDLGCAFKTFVSFDVALTFRNNQRQPINSGVIMIRGTLESLTR